MIETIRDLAIQKAKEAMERREEILTAFVAKYGYEPDEMILCEQPSTGKFWVEKKNKWISVKDRLPEFDKEVITFESDGFIKIAYIMKDPIDNSINWFDHEGIESSPSFWMSLPEPPEKE